MTLILIWKNLLRNRRRTVLTVLGVAISMFLFCGLLSVLTVMNNVLKDAESSSVLAVRNQYSMTDGVMPAAYIERIRKVQGVQTICPLNFVNTYVTPGQPTLFGLASDPQTAREIFPEFQDIPADDYQNFVRERTGALIGKENLDTFGWKVGDLVTLHGASVPVDIPIKITGTIPYGGLADNFMMHRDYLEDLVPDKGNVNMVLVKVDQSHPPAQVIQALDSAFQGEAVKVKTETLKNVLVALIGQVDGIKAVIAFVAFVILISTLLLASNSIAMSMRERVREMAVLQTIGFTPRRVMTLVMGESLLTVLLGGVLGSLAAYIFFYYVGLNFRISSQSYFNMPVETLLEGLLLCGLVGLLSGLVPALGSVRMVLAHALRRVG